MVNILRALTERRGQPVWKVGDVASKWKLRKSRKEIENTVTEMKSVFDRSPAD